jgi:archaellum component FlaF (FlaF/FlaG flagellin family)
MIINEGSAVNTGYTGSQQPIIQNLGPGDIYFNMSGIDVLTEGIYIPYLPAGVSYEFPATLVEAGGTLFIQVATGGASADVRIVNVG